MGDARIWGKKQACPELTVDMPSLNSCLNLVRSTPESPESLCLLSQVTPDVYYIVDWCHIFTKPRSRSFEKPEGGKASRFRAF